MYMRVCVCVCVCFWMTVKRNPSRYLYVFRERGLATISISLNKKR